MHVISRRDRLTSPFLDPPRRVNRNPVPLKPWHYRKISRTGRRDLTQGEGGTCNFTITANLLTLESGEIVSEEGGENYVEQVFKLFFPVERKFWKGQRLPLPLLLHVNGDTIPVLCGGRRIRFSDLLGRANCLGQFSLFLERRRGRDEGENGYNFLREEF